MNVLPFPSMPTSIEILTYGCPLRIVRGTLVDLNFEHPHLRTTACEGVGGLIGVGLGKGQFKPLGFA